MPAGAPGPWQPTPRMPSLPSEYSILRITFPLAPPVPIKSVFTPGVCKFANCQLARLVTTYVPLPVETPLVKVSQVPPPVTALDVPPLAGATKVPVPVSLIVRLALADANAIPPALTVLGAGGMPKATLTMSQRTWSAEPCTTGRPTVMHNNTAKDRTVIAEIHLAGIFMFVLLSLVDPLGKNLVWQPFPERGRTHPTPDFSDESSTRTCQDTGRCLYRGKGVEDLL